MPPKKQHKTTRRSQPPRRPRPSISFPQPIVVQKEPERSIGESLGSKVGGFLGNAAQNIFKRITGLGDYTISQNSLINNVGASPPVFNTLSDRSTVIRHREYITDVTGSVAFNLTQYAINPGLIGTFPWLSSVANNYETYQLKGMVFEYKSTSAVALNSTNTALGTVVLATQYDVADPQFSTKINMENYEFSTSASPATSMMHPIECDPSKSPLARLYIRAGAPASGRDSRFYDIGNFNIATVGMQAASVIGELWVTYEVELFKPKLYQGFFAPCSSWYLLNSVDSTHILGTSQTLNYAVTYFQGLSFSGQTVSITDTRIAGATLMVTWNAVGTSTNTTGGGPGFSALVGCSATTAFHNCIGSSNFQTTSSACVALNIQQLLTVSSNATAVSFTLSGGSIPTSITAAELIITVLF